MSQDSTTHGTPAAYVGESTTSTGLLTKMEMAEGKILCESTTLRGPSFASTTEGLHCDMTARVLRNIAGIKILALPSAPSQSHFRSKCCPNIAFSYFYPRKWTGASGALSCAVSVHLYSRPTESQPTASPRSCQLKRLQQLRCVSCVLVF